MIIEDYVSFEVSKLLKEKGFDEECYWYYPINGGEVQELSLDELNYHRSQFIKAPTHQMAMKWLREKHNLFIFPFPQMNTSKFWAEIYQLSDNQKWKNLYCESIDLQDYQTYEEACEAALKYSLENLI